MKSDYGNAYYRKGIAESKIEILKIQPPVTEELTLKDAKAYNLPDKNMGGDINVYSDNLGKLIKSFNKEFDDLLNGDIGVDELWNTIMTIRSQVRTGRNLIDNDKKLDDLENLIINISNQKMGFRKSIDLGDELEANKFRNYYLSLSQRYIDSINDLVNELKGARENTTTPS